MPRPLRASPLPPKPVLCSSLAQARSEIDRIDLQMITLLANRQLWTAAALTFTPAAPEQPRTERLLDGIRQRCAWAKAQGLDPAFAEILFSTLIARDFSADAQRRASSSAPT
jgi:isochorismate pyruvate lyase